VVSLIIAVIAAGAHSSIPFVVYGIITSTAGALSVATYWKHLSAVNHSNKVFTKVPLHHRLSGISPKSSVNSVVVSAKRSPGGSGHNSNHSYSNVVLHRPDSMTESCIRYGTLLCRCIMGFWCREPRTSNKASEKFGETSIHDIENYATNLENEMLEFKSMIANAAHDLKTPLTAFMNGIETSTQVSNDIADRLLECRAAFVGEDLSLHLSALHDDVALLKGTLNSMINTNSFMLMSINRAIDFSKASNGISLVPRPETFIIRELFAYTMNCVKDLNPMSNIVFNPIPASFCSSIITDRQWLMENLLCLLSNAVKFSPVSSVVTVNAQLRRKKALPVSRYRENMSLSSRLGAGPGSVSRNSKMSSRLPAGTVLEKNLVLLNDKLGPIASTSARFGASSNHSNNASCNHSVDCSGNSVATNNQSEVFVYVEVEDGGIGVIGEAARESLFDGYRQTSRLSGGTVSTL
jgi:signal transduction histidine kinase